MKTIILSIFSFFIFINNTFANNSVLDERLLSLSSKGNNAQLIQMVIDGGADVNVKDKQGYTPLLYSCAKGYYDNVKVLLENGADVNVKLKKETPILLAMKNDNITPEILELLIEKGADVNVKDDIGRTPLIIASTSYTDTKVIEVLLDAGAKINAIGGGSRALDMACSFNSNPDIIKLLLKRGADAKLTDSIGRSAIYYAKMNENLIGTEAMKMLEKASQRKL